MLPQNAGYYHAAYVAAAVIFVVYAAGLVWRASRLRRRLAELDAQSQQ